MILYRIEVTVKKSAPPPFNRKDARVKQRSQSPPFELFLYFQVWIHEILRSCLPQNDVSSFTILQKNIRHSERNAV